MTENVYNWQYIPTGQSVCKA